MACPVKILEARVPGLGLKVQSQRVHPVVQETHSIHGIQDTERRQIISSEACDPT